MLIASLVAAAAGTNLRRRKAPSPILQKPELFAIQSPEGPNNFNPEALPVWMRPTAPNGDGAAASDIGAAASADTPVTTQTSKDETLKQKFGDVQTQSTESSANNNVANSQPVSTPTASSSEHHNHL